MGVRKESGNDTLRDSRNVDYGEEINFLEVREIVFASCHMDTRIWSEAGTFLFNHSLPSQCEIPVKGCSGTVRVEKCWLRKTCIKWTMTDN